MILYTFVEFYGSLGSTQICPHIPPYLGAYTRVPVECYIVDYEHFVQKTP